MKTLVKTLLLTCVLSVSVFMTQGWQSSEALAAPPSPSDSTSVDASWLSNLIYATGSSQLKPLFAPTDDQPLEIHPVGDGSDPVVVDSGTEYGPCVNGQRTVTNWTEFSDGTGMSSITFEPCTVEEPPDDGILICVDGIDDNGKPFGYCYNPECDNPGHNPDPGCPVHINPDCDQNPDGPDCTHEDSGNPGGGDNGGPENGGSDSGMTDSGTPAQPQTDVTPSRLPMTGINGTALLFIISFALTALVIAYSVRRLASGGDKR